MKKINMIILLLLLSILTACGESSSNTEVDTGSSESSDADTQTFRLGHVTQTSHPYHLAAEHFAGLVEERSNGELKFDLYPARQLGGDLEMLEMIQNGSLDSGFISNAIFSGSTPVMDGLQLPFLLDSYELFGEVIQTDVVKEMLDSLATMNLKGLAVNESGMRHVGSNLSSIQSPEDMEGLKIRVSESPLMLDIFNTLGASPTPMAYGEIYSSLQTGVIDAHEANLPAYIDENFYEVTEYITLTTHFPWPNVNVMNLDTFNNLSEEHQQIIEEAAFETAVWITEQLVEIDEKSIEELESAGADVQEIENLEPFIEAVQPVYDKYAEKDPLIKELIEVANDLKQ